MTQRPAPAPALPIAWLAFIAGLIANLLTWADAQVVILEDVRTWPSVLDDATVAYVVLGCMEQRDDLWRYEEHLRDWRAGTLTDEQRREVERLAGQLGRVRAVIDKALALAEEVASGTSETMMAKDDRD